MTDKLPPPCTLGLPEKFEEWRDNQDSAVIFTLESDKRFVTLVCPTGFGKSLTYTTVAKLRGGRSVFLTSTKGLQSQLVRDFGESGLVDVRGRNAFPCMLEHDGTRCDHGPCIAGFHCRLKDKGECLYHAQVARARGAAQVVTNYAFWMYNNEYGEGLGDFNLMVCDEAHDTPDQVSSFLTIALKRKDTVVQGKLPRSNLSEMSINDWVIWACSHRESVVRELEYLKEQGKSNGSLSKTQRHKYAELATFLRAITGIARMDNTWVFDVGTEEITFSPVWPARYCETVLFRNIPHVINTSASVCAKTVEMLGIDQDTHVLKEYPHSFAVENRRVIHVSTYPPVRLNFRADDKVLRFWLNRIEQILQRREHLKGIIHTVSYDRRNFVLQHSRFKDNMITHKRSTAEEVVARFKKSEPPATLVSPSMTTGWDFPGSECRYQIIGKLAYPDTRNKIVKARSKDDAEYPAYVAMMQLMQACGRGTRSVDDYCENFIIDDNIGWFMTRFGKFSTDWFRESFTRTGVVPGPGI